MTSPTSRSSRREGQPNDLAQGNPSDRDIGYDHSFTLQAIMEMQKALGVLGEKVSRLSSDINGMGTRVEVFGDKLDKVRHWQSVVSGGAIVIAAIAAIAWSIITFLPWDRIHIDTAPRIEAKPAATKG